MPSDIDAAVISNARLSDDYCIVSLEAPEIAALAQPGQDRKSTRLNSSHEWISYAVSLDRKSVV